MFIDTLEFTIPVDLCNLYMTLQQQGTKSQLDFPASVNSYGTTQDANVQVALRANKVTFKVDGVSSNASIISKSECKTLKLSVFDVDRSLMPQNNANNSSGMSPVHQPQPVSNASKRLHEQSVSLPQPPAKSSRTSFSESSRPRSPLRRSQPQSSPRPSSNTQSKSHHNDTPVNVKQEPEDPDLIEIEPDHDPDDVVPKKETPYMQIDYSSDVPHTQTSQAALDRLSHPQSSHSQSPGSSSSSFHQNVPHAPDYAEPSTSQHVQGQYGDQSADEFLVFQDDNDYGDDNEADYSNDGLIEVEYVTSRRGTPQVLFQGHLHSRNSTKKHCVHWRCVVKSCRGRVTTVGNYIRNSTPHNHGPREPDTVRFISNLRKRAREETTPIPTLYQEALAQEDPDLVPHLPSFASLSSALYRHRKHTITAPPETRGDVELESADEV